MYRGMGGWLTGLRVGCGTGEWVGTHLRLVLPWQVLLAEEIAVKTKGTVSWLGAGLYLAG